MKTKAKNLITMLLIGVVAIVVGILIINHTDSFLKIVMIAAGIGAAISGVYTLIGVKKWHYTDLTKTLATIKGFESLVAGIAAVLVALFAADTALTVMVYIFAVGLVFSAIVSFENAAVVNKFDILDMRSHFIVEGVIYLLIAILLFCKPVDTLVKVVQILSIGFIVIGAIMVAVPIITLFKGRGKEDEVVVEAEMVADEKEDE
ncbi:MAG: DUF308 domain-containing protein [Spirochaetales bacterium]|nr:DUF308 domain-containing protein [Spirochaetales bacterium]